MDKQKMYEAAQKRADAKIQFYIHLAVYLGVNLLLMIINLRSLPGKLWFLWVLCGWGIGVAVHGLKVLGVFDFSTARKRLIEKELAKEKYKKQMEEKS